MAIDTIISNPVKLQFRCRFMAVGTSGVSVGAHQRKTIVLVQLSNIVHQPILRIMASCAVCSDSLIVHIGMAGNTVLARFRKDQGFMARSAVHPGVLTGKGKIGCIVVKFRSIPSDLPTRHLRYFRLRRFVEFPGIKRNFPSVRRMAGSAVDLEISTVRRLGKQIDRQPHEQYYRWQSIHRKLLNLYWTMNSPFISVFL